MPHGSLHFPKLEILRSADIPISENGKLEQYLMRPYRPKG